MTSRSIAALTFALLSAVVASAAGIGHDQARRDFAYLTLGMDTCEPPPPPFTPQSFTPGASLYTKGLCKHAPTAAVCVQAERLQLRMPAHPGDTTGLAAAGDAARVADRATHVKTMAADHAPVVAGACSGPRDIELT